MNPQDRLIVALDVPCRDDAMGYVDSLLPEVRQFKVGLELFCAEGRPLLDEIRDRGGRVFLDLKLHDIPNTVESAARILHHSGVWMTNVHASGGPDMMRAAREAFPEEQLLAVTVLTSLDQRTVNEFWGTEYGIEQIVQRWAVAAQEEGLNGVVCSPREIEPVRRAAGSQFTVVTPGIRPRWAASGDDQRRVTTPRQAVFNGADYLVIGRPITGAESPKDAAGKIVKELRDEAGDYDG